MTKDMKTLIEVLDEKGVNHSIDSDGKVSIGGDLYLGGYEHDFSLDGLSINEVLFEGERFGHNFEVVDGIGCVVLSEKTRDGTTIKHCRKAKFEDGEIVGDRFYVASNGEENAHGKTIKDAIEELAFKTAIRDISQYKNMPMDTVKTPDEWAFVYRMATGSCRYGVTQFMKSQGALKKKYTLLEIIKITNGAYGHETFKGAVS